MLRLARSAAVLLVLTALPLAAAEELTDPDGDADGPLDVVSVAWSLGPGNATVEVRLDPGESPQDRAVRGVLLIGTPGQPEPAEWYQFTIANETTAYAGHDGPRLATLVSTSFTGDVARLVLQREAPADGAPCAFAVVEAGTLSPTGFVRSDVAPTGFASPESAWPVDACPPAHTPVAVVEDESEKDSPLAPWLALLALAVAVAVRRR